jgi:hypothetical protein
VAGWGGGCPNRIPISCCKNHLSWLGNRARNLLLTVRAFPCLMHAPILMVGGRGSKRMEKSTGKGTLCTSWLCLVLKKYLFHIRHCFICRPSDAAVSEDAGGRTEDFYDFGIGSQMLFITLGYRSFLYTLGFRSLPHSVIDIINIRL